VRAAQPPPAAAAPQAPAANTSNAAQHTGFIRHELLKPFTYTHSRGGWVALLSACLHAGAVTLSHIVYELQVRRRPPLLKFLQQQQTAHNSKHRAIKKLMRYAPHALPHVLPHVLPCNTIQYNAVVATGRPARAAVVDNSAVL
jgi:hypothetical protein